MAAAAVFAVLVAITVGASFNLWGLPDRQDGDISTEFNFTKHELPEGVKYLYLPKMLPQGYQESDYITSNMAATLYYTNANDLDTPQIILTQFFKTDFFTFDAEDVSIQTITVGEYSGQTYFKDGTNVIFWNNGDYAFVLSSTLPVEELVKIGESLQKQA